MARPCSVCSHPQIAQINKLFIVDNWSPRRVAETFGLSPYACTRHKSNYQGSHLPEDLIEAERKRREEAHERARAEIEGTLATVRVWDEAGYIHEAAVTGESVSKFIMALGKSLAADRHSTFFLIKHLIEKDVEPDLRAALIVALGPLCREVLEDGPGTVRMPSNRDGKGWREAVFNIHEPVTEQIPRYIDPPRNSSSQTATATKRNEPERNPTKEAPVSAPFTKSAPPGTRRVVRAIEPMEVPDGHFHRAGDLVFLDDDSFSSAPTVWDMDPDEQEAHFGRRMFEPEPEPVRRSRDQAARVRHEWDRDRESHSRPRVSRSRTLAEPKA